MLIHFMKSLFSNMLLLSYFFIRTGNLKKINTLYIFYEKKLNEMYKLLSENDKISDNVMKNYFSSVL